MQDKRDKKQCADIFEKISNTDMRLVESQRHCEYCALNVRIRIPRDNLSLTYTLLAVHFEPAAHAVGPLSGRGQSQRSLVLREKLT